MNGKSGNKCEAIGERIASLENELRHAESKWRSVIEHVPQIGVSLDTEGRIVFANQHFLELTGWAFEEIRGGDWFDLFLQEEEREEVREVFKDTMSRKDVGEHSRYQNNIVTRDGQVRDISWFNVLTKGPDGRISDVTCLGIDLTAMEETEAALRESEKRLSLALEAAKDAVWEWAPASRRIF